MPTSRATAPLSGLASALRSLRPARAPYPRSRFVPHRRPRLPRPAHWAPAPAHACSARRALPVRSVRTGIALPDRAAGRPLSCGTFRGEPATRRFDWSFAPTPRSCHRVARQNGSGPPPGLPPASPSPGIVHRLSGRMRAAPATPRVSLRSAPRAPPVGLAAHMHSLVRVSRRGQPVGSRQFHAAPSRDASFLSRYLSAIGLPLYLAFDGRDHRFTLHYQAGLLAHCAPLRGSTLSGCCIRPLPHNSVARLPWGLLPVRSPLLQKSLLVSSPPSSDMLKSKGSSAAAPLSDTAQSPPTIVPHIASVRVLPRRGSRGIPCRPCRVSTTASGVRPRVILPQVPLRQPCYDLYPI